MNINMAAMMGTVILSTDEYRKLVEDRLAATNASKDLITQNQQLESALATACADVAKLKSDLEDQKHMETFWYSSYQKVNVEMQTLKDKLAALVGTHEATP